MKVGYTNSRNKRSALENILIIHEIFYVFVEEIPGMHPKRHIDFTIESGPGATPILKSPSRMNIMEQT